MALLNASRDFAVDQVTASSLFPAALQQATTRNDNRNNKDFNNQQRQGIVPFPVALQKGTTRNNEKQ